MLQCCVRLSSVYLSVCNACIVAKRCVLAKNCTKKQIGNGLCESNGHMTDDVTWPWKVEVMSPIRLGPNISKTAGYAIFASIANCRPYCETVRSAILATAWLLVKTSDRYWFYSSIRMIPNVHNSAAKIFPNSIMAARLNKFKYIAHVLGCLQIHDTSQSSCNIL